MNPSGQGPKSCEEKTNRVGFRDDSSIITTTSYSPGGVSAGNRITPEPFSSTVTRVWMVFISLAPFLRWIGAPRLEIVGDIRRRSILFALLPGRPHSLHPSCRKSHGTSRGWVAWDAKGLSRAQHVARIDHPSNRRNPISFLESLS